MITIFLANFLFIWGMKFAFSPDQVLDFPNFRLYIAKNNLNWIRKPLLDCAPCMSSVYGIPGFLLTNLDWWFMFIWIPCLAGLSAIIIKLSTVRNL